MRADNAVTWRPVAVTPILPVTDLERSVSWFRDVMGFGVNFIEGSWASLSKNGFELLLHSVDQPPEPRWIFVHVANVDQVFEGFRSSPGLVERFTPSHGEPASSRSKPQTATDFASAMVRDRGTSQTNCGPTSTRKQYPAQVRLEHEQQGLWNFSPRS
jgi:catechol 2,3-dioxygenase-like lactoylglutathione lyase family enzyme